MNFGTFLHEAAEQIKNQSFSTAYKAQLAANAASGLLMAAGHRRFAVAYSLLGGVPMASKFSEVMADMSDGQKIGLAAGAAAGVAANIYLTRFRAYRALWQVGSAVSGAALVMLETTEAGKDICAKVDETLERALGVMSAMRRSQEPTTETTMAQ